MLCCCCYCCHFQTTRGFHCIHSFARVCAIRIIGRSLRFSDPRDSRQYVDLVALTRPRLSLLENWAPHRHQQQRRTLSACRTMPSGRSNRMPSMSWTTSCPLCRPTALECCWRTLAYEALDNLTLCLTHWLTHWRWGVLLLAVGCHQDGCVVHRESRGHLQEGRHSGAQRCRSRGLAQRVVELQYVQLDAPARVWGLCGHSSRSLSNHRVEDDYECYICGDEFTAAEFYRLRCGHGFCIGCWRDYLTLQVKEKAQLITCQGMTGSEKCRMVMDETDIIKLLVREREPRAHTHTHISISHERGTVCGQRE